MYESIELIFDKRIQTFDKLQKKRAKLEIKDALTKALVTLLDELDATEEDMDLLDENPGSTGLPGLQRLRKLLFLFHKNHNEIFISGEMLEGREELGRQYEESGLSATDFIKKKIAGKDVFFCF